jgi:UPF0755 protein
LTKKTSVIWVSLLSFVVAVAVVTAFFGFQLLKKPVGDTQDEIVFEVPPKATLPQIAQELQNKRLIRNAKVFRYYVRIKGQAGKIKTGEYALNQSMSPDEIVSVLVSGKSKARSITVAEGLNIYDIAALFERSGIGTAQEVYDLVHDKNFIKETLGEEVASLEGYLYPETYKYTKYEDVKSVLAQMVKRFLAVWNAEIAAEAQKLGWSRHQVVTFASIVEKETGASFERPLVSSVFHNRLVKKMRLQTDPTVLYGMAIQQKKMPTNISRNDLLTPTPYNSYTNYGLPPGPIANPGREALLATLNPQKTNYLYFVSQNNGTHVFSETLQQHNRAVQQYQLNAKARANKSWRDLNKSANK